MSALWRSKAERAAHVAKLRAEIVGRIPPVWGEIVPKLSDKAVERLTLACEMATSGWLTRESATREIFRTVAKDQKDSAVLAGWWEQITGQAIQPAEARDRFRNVLRYANV